MRRLSLSAFTILLVGVVALVACPRDGGIHASGRVVDLQGRPLAGVRIALDSLGHGWSFADRTGADGCFYAGGLTAPGHYFYDLRTEAPGFKLATAKVPTLEDNYLLIVLAPAEVGARSVVSRQTVDPCGSRLGISPAGALSTR
jgi:hypothetical protein